MRTKSKARYWQGKKIKRSIMQKGFIETTTSFKLYTLLPAVLTCQQSAKGNSRTKLAFEAWQVTCLYIHLNT